MPSEIKKHISIPVIAVNNIKEPSVAESLLEEGVCDFIGLGRALLADPEWVNKAKEGKENEIRSCIGCLYCFENLGKGKHIACTVNARLGRENEYKEFKKDGNKQVVAVVGAGPSGMEAARVLAERDYKVVLFEKGDKLGGTLNVADKPLLKEKITKCTTNMGNELNRDNIEIRYNTQNALEEVKAINPVGVFVASGAAPIVPNSIKGINLEKVVKAEDVLTGAVKLSGKVAVIGSGMTGCETAEFLADKGCSVALVEMAAQVGPGIYPPVLMDLFDRFNKHNPEILVKHKLTEVTDTGVKLLNAETDETISKDFDYVVLALGVTPNEEFVSEFENAFGNVRVLGDASKAGRIVDAIADEFGKAFIF